MSTTVTKPTLTYFGVLGRAEVARVILEDAGVDYDYVTVSNWPDLKAQLTAAGKIPFGKVPLYEEPEGLVLVQSAAIARHLARKHGYSGANAHEEALIDQANEGVVEAFAGAFKAAFGSPEDKAEAQEKLLRETLPAQLATFEKLLEKNGNNGHFVGSKLSYADINLWVTLEFFFVLVESSRHSLLRGFPAVKKLTDAVVGRERIKAYVARDVYNTKRAH